MLFILLIIYLLWPLKVFEVHSLEVTNSPIRPGDSIQIRLERCKKFDIPTTISVTFYNASVHSLPYTMRSTAPKGCRLGDDAIVGTLYVPEALVLHPGKWTMRYTLTSEVFYKQIVESYETPPFEVRSGFEKKPYAHRTHSHEEPTILV